MLINIIGGSYQAKYVSVNPQKAINWYIHKKLIETQQDLYESAWYPTPGLASFSDTTRTQPFGAFVAKTLTEERYFIVVDNYLYEVDVDGVATNRGQMTNMTPSSKVYMEVNGNGELLIAHSSASYYLTLSTNVLAQVTDGDFPGSVDSLTYTAGYFIVTSGGRVYYSDLNSASSWNAASVFTPTARADNTLAVIAWRDDIYCFGAETIEVYINDGSSPFSKMPKSTIFVGLAAAESIVTFRDGFLFLGKTKYGQHEVYYYNGQDLLPISSPINWAINNPSLIGGVPWEELTVYTWEDWFDLWNAGISTSYADIQQNKEGHVFYFLTVPFLDTTFVYDLQSKEWTERQSLNPNSSTQSEFRGRFFVNFKNLDLWADIYTGKVLQEDYTIATEDGSAITRTGISSVVSNENKFISAYSLEVDCNSGIGLIATPATSPNISLYVSKDGGNTYGTARSLSVGASGSYNQRAYATKLGTARKFVFKLVVTDAADIMIQKVILHGIVGSW